AAEGGVDRVVAADREEHCDQGTVTSNCPRFLTSNCPRFLGGQLLGDPGARGPAVGEPCERVAALRPASDRLGATDHVALASPQVMGDPLTALLVMGEGGRLAGFQQ